MELAAALAGKAARVAKAKVVLKWPASRRGPWRSPPPRRTRRPDRGGVRPAWDKDVPLVDHARAAPPGQLEL